MSRELRNMGDRKLSARPRHHAQADGAIEDFKKVSRRAWRRSPEDKGVDPAAIEIWFADEAHIGQKNKITRRWAKLTKGSVKRSLMEWAAEGRRGNAPAPHDQRAASTFNRRDLPEGGQARGASSSPPATPRR